MRAADEAAASVKRLREAAKNFTGDLNGTGEKAREFRGIVLDAFGDAAQEAKAMGGSVKEQEDRMTTSFQGIVKNLREKGIKASDIREFLKNMDLAPGQVDKVMGTVGDKAGGTARTEGQYVGDAVAQGVATGIEKSTWMIDAAARAAARSARAAAEDELGIKSPSRVFMQIGEYISEGLGKGVERKARAVAQAVRALARATTDEARKAARDSLNEAKNDNRNLWKQIRQTTIDSARDALDKWKDFAQGVLDYIDGVIDKVRDFAKLSGFDLGAIDQATKDLTDATLALADAVKAQAEAEKELEKAIAASEEEEIAKARERLAEASDKVAAANRRVAASQERVNKATPTAANIIQDMRSRLMQAAQFGSIIQTLAASGLNNKSLQELINMGPGAGAQLGQAIIEGGLPAIEDINRLESALYGIGAALGDIGAQSEFGMTGAQARGVMGTTVNLSNGAIVINFGAGTSISDRNAIQIDIETAVEAALMALGREINAS